MYIHRVYKKSASLCAISIYYIIVFVRKQQKKKTGGQGLLLKVQASVA